MESEKKADTKKSNLAERLSTYIFYISVFIFLVAFNFRDKMTGGWYQQFLPNLNGRNITDITFLDSLTGYAVTNGSNSTTGYIIKTTNGGDNWNIIYSANNCFNRVVFLNYNTGFICGGWGYGNILKTTNAGNNWTIFVTPFGVQVKDIAVINADTILAADDSGFDGGIYKTTDGCQSWVRTFNGGSQNPDKVYMYNKNIGFFTNGGLYKTTNGGINWFSLDGGGFTDLYFSDSLTGWKAWGDIKKTTNGGMNWETQQLPQGGIITVSSMISLKNISNDTIWGVGGEAYVGTAHRRGLIYKTTNGGINWGYQLPDTSIIRINKYYYIDFVDKFKGWCFNYTTDIHTVTGGLDSTIFTGINNLTQTTPKNFEMKQNYPNPFNNSTLIYYYINETGWVKLKVFDITGKEMGTLVNEVQNIGGYGIPVSIPLSSGVYFYKLVYTNRKGELQTDTKKMIVVK